MAVVARVLKMTVGVAHVAAGGGGVVGGVVVGVVLATVVKPVRTPVTIFGSLAVCI